MMMMIILCFEIALVSPSFPAPPPPTSEAGNLPETGGWVGGGGVDLCSLKSKLILVYVVFVLFCFDFCKLLFCNYTVNDSI